jgi:lipoate-protein ligase A
MVRRVWNLFEYALHPGAVNMVLDEKIASLMQDDGSMRPVLRLYGWEPWAISLGHHQDRSDIDVERCRERGIDLVRRPTGGRAILHAQELTYSVIMPADRRSVLEVYNEISRALVKGLSFIGAEVELQKSQPDFRAEYRKAASIPCFASSARYEIEWHGKKLVGSAQRRFSGGERDVVLQHGSILCGPAHRELPSYLRVADPAAHREVGRILRDHTTDLSTVLGRTIDGAELAECIRAGFETEWNLTFEPDPLLINELRPSHA